MYKISVILPVYNVEDYLGKCLNSLINQTIGFENLEIIFVDDCSSDNSFKLIQNYTKKYDNIKLFQSEWNSGSAGHPRNIGLKHASADYIMFLDPDDLLFEDACEKLYINIINADADLVSGNYVKISNGEEVKLMDFKKKFGITGDYLEISSIHDCPQLLTMIPALWAKIYKSSFIYENNFLFPEKVIGQDLYFVINCLLKAKKIVFIDMPIVKYEIREDGQSKSVTATVNRRNLLSYAFIYNKLYNLFLNFDKKYDKFAAIHLHFATAQFVRSNDKLGKFDYLYNSKQLYSLFKENYNPQKKYEKLFDLIYDQKYIEVLKLSDLIYSKLYDNKKVLDNIKNRNILIVYKDNEMDLKYLLTYLINNIDFIKENNLYINIINLNSYYTNDLEYIKTQLKKEFKDNTISNLLNYTQFTNINQYYDSKFNNNDNNINYNKVINNFKSNENEKQFYTTDGFNYLSIIDEDSNTIVTLHDKLGEYDLSFSSIEDFEEYFILNNCLKYNSKIFLLNCSSSTNPIENISENLFYKVNSINMDESLADNLLNCFIDSEIKEISIMNNYEKNIKLINDLEDELFKLNKLIDDKEKINNDNEILKNKLNVEYDSKKRININQMGVIKENQNLINKQKDAIDILETKLYLLERDISDKNEFIEFIISENNKLNHEIESKKPPIIEQDLTEKESNNFSNLRKKLFSPLSYLYILYNHEDMLDNIKLYHMMQKSNWFDECYYLNENRDISRKKWCNIFSPELHYVCHGFNEKRQPRSDYSNNMTKKELLQIIK